MQEEIIIPINIWDDYWDDGYVPKGEKQETHAYVEDSDFPIEIKCKVMEILEEHILLNFEKQNEFNMIRNDEEIYFKNLTHKTRYELVEFLQQSNLNLFGTKFNIYSES